MEENKDNEALKAYAEREWKKLFEQWYEETDEHTTTDAMKSGILSEAIKAQPLVGLIQRALSDPYVMEKLRTLRRGIGTATNDAIWLEMEAALRTYTESHK